MLIISAFLSGRENERLSASMGTMIASLVLMGLSRCADYLGKIGFDFDDIEVEVKKCAKPTINYSNGKLSFVCETEDAICQASITDTDIKTYSGNEIQLGVTYFINVYATKAGYENSETVTATLCWIEQQPMMEGVTNNISQIPAKAMLIHCQGGMLTIYGVDEGSDIAVYTVSGQMVGSIRANGNQAVLTTNIKKGEVAIIKIGEKSVKVVMQ